MILENELAKNFNSIGWKLEQRMSKQQNSYQSKWLYHHPDLQEWSNWSKDPQHSMQRICPGDAGPEGKEHKT